MFNLKFNSHTAEVFRDLENADISFFGLAKVIELVKTIKTNPFF